MKKLSLIAVGIAVFGIAAAASFNTGGTKMDSQQQADCWNNPQLLGQPTLVQATDCPGGQQICCYKRENPSDPMSPIESFNRNAN